MLFIFYLFISFLGSKVLLMNSKARVIDDYIRASLTKPFFNFNFIFLAWRE